MARLFIDGFESGGMDLWDTVGGFSASATSPASGSYCAYGSSVTSPMLKTVSNNSEYYAKWRYREGSNTSAPDNQVLFAVYKGATKLVDIIHRSDEKLEARRGGVTSLGIGTYTSLNDTWHLLEVYIKIDDSVGVCQLKIDGVLDLDLTGIDTKPGADTIIDTIEFGVAEGYNKGYVDDVVIDDASWIGDSKIQALSPTGAGNSTGWTPSVGNNWDCIEEIPVSDADYVSINAVDTTDTYVTANIIGSIDSIKCVQIQSRSRTEGSPVPTNIKLAVRSGAADYLSGDKSVPVSAKSLYNIWETNPADAAAWEEADINAMEIGIKSAA